MKKETFVPKKGNIILLGFVVMMNCSAAFALDLVVGDPHRLPHPVRWMGNAISTFEPVFRKLSSNLVFCGTLFAVALIAATWAATFFMIEAAEQIHPLLKSCVEIAKLIHIVDKVVVCSKKIC